MLFSRFLRITAIALLLLLFSALCAAFFCAEASCPLHEPRIIAHRCYNAAEEAPENSLEALKSALKREYLYAVEMDVWVTADGVVLVHHDGVIGSSLLECSRYEEVKDVRLANGECLPTLASFLDLLRTKPALKAVIEIKEHVYAENGLRAADAIMCLVREYGVESQIEYQSFDVAICRRIISHDPTAVVGYPRGDLPPAELERRGFRIMDYHYGLLFARPSWIAEARARGIQPNAYTLNSRLDMLHAANLGIGCITTDFPEDLRRVLEWRRKSALSPLMSKPQLTRALCALRNAPLAIVYALQESCRNPAESFKALLGLDSLSLVSFYSLLSAAFLLLVFAAMAWYELRRRASRQARLCAELPGRGAVPAFLLSFCSPCGRIAPLAFWWRQFLLIFPLYLCTRYACLVGQSMQGQVWGLLDEASVLSVLLTQLCPPGLYASGLACLGVHYAGEFSHAPVFISTCLPAAGLLCLLLSLLAAWCCLALVLRRLRDARFGLLALPLCLTLPWTQFIMLTMHRPVWLDDALLLLVFFVAMLCLCLPSRGGIPAEKGGDA